MSEAEPDDDDSLHPLGPEFWVGQVLMILGIGAGIWLAFRVGISDTVKFTKLQDCRLARTTLASVRTEFMDNLRQVQNVKTRLEEGKNAKIDIQTSFLDSAQSKGYMTVVDPELLADIERLFVHPMPKVADTLEKIDKFDQFPQQKKWILEVVDRILEKAQTRILPMFDRVEADLKRTEDSLREAR